jgi:phosphorylcholine metabolism protein LicD
MNKNCPPHKVKNSGCDKYGIPRLELAIHLKEILNKMNLPWYIENGTLLGSYRNSKFIPHDDDFDIAILYKNYSLEKLREDMNFIKKHLDKKYKIRLIDTYSQKLEVYDPNFGNYNLVKEYYNNADYHHVTVDLQAYTFSNNNYSSLHNHSNDKHKENDIFPLKSIELEHNIFPCPNNTKQILVNTYGSLDENAKYNPITKKYEL